MKCQKKSRTVKNHFKDTDDISLEELVNQISCAPNDYKNLQIFLHWDRKINYHSETEFLMVTPTCFGKVKISNLSVENNSIIIEFVDCQNQEIGIAHVNIYEEKPSVLFICWQDIRSMFESTEKTSLDNSELLEFDY
jgi:hypothetical protein